MWKKRNYNNNNEENYVNNIVNNEQIKNKLISLFIELVDIINEEDAL